MILELKRKLVRTIKSFSAVVALVALQSLAAQAQVTFSVYAGTTGSPGYSGDGGHRLSARFHDNWGIAIDNYRGLLYVVDFNNHAVRQINMATDIITTYAGGSVGFAGDGGLATAAKLRNPTGITIDAAGNIYIYDIYNYRIRMVERISGKINTIIGTGTAGYSGDGGPANLANIGPCNGLSSTAAGKIYLPSYGFDKIRTISPSGISSPGTINFYGGSISGFAGDGSLIGAATKFNYLNDLKYDWNTGNIFISDWLNDRIRKIDGVTGKVSTYAGTGVVGYTPDGAPANTAKLNGPMGFDVDCYGNLYFCDVDNHIIRKIDAAGNIFTVAGNPTVAGSSEGKNKPGEFNRPVGLAIDAIGDMYVSDRNNSRIVKLAFEAKVCEGNTITLCDKTGTGTWSSSDPSVASISASGVITGVSAGVAVIKLTIGSYFLTKTVTVVAAPSPISGPSSVAIGGTITLTDGTVGGTWSSSGTFATVDASTGVVTGVAAGVETITYTTAAGCFETYTVKVDKDKGPKCIDDARLEIGYGIDAAGNCYYTANVSVSTGYTIVGYDWSLPSGPVVSHSSAPSDMQTFTLPGGSTFMVHVKIHVVKTDWAPGESPCCEMDLEEKVSCEGRATGCFDEIQTTLTAFSKPGDFDRNGTPCNFTLTANAVLLPGVTLVGYRWDDGTVISPIGPSNTFTVSLASGTTKVITVTIYALDAAGNECSMTRTITLDCNDGQGISRKSASQGTSKNLTAKGINIYPNPTSGEVEIVSGDTEISNVQVIDVNGKKMGSYDFTQTKSAKVSLSNFPPGNYLFRVNNSTSKVVTKVK